MARSSKIDSYTSDTSDTTDNGIIEPDPDRPKFWHGGDLSHAVRVTQWIIELRAISPPKTQSPKSSRSEFATRKNKNSASNPARTRRQPLGSLSVTSAPASNSQRGQHNNTIMGDIGKDCSEPILDPPAGHASTIIDNDEDDLVVASYDIYIRPQWTDGRQLYVMQFPNRSEKKDYCAAQGTQPMELRIKPSSGLVEMDVPLDPFNNYDRAKGALWGENLRKSTMLKSNTGTGGSGGSHGLAGGFGIGGVAPGPGRSRQKDEDPVAAQQEILADFNDGITKGRVLTKQTLGGQVLPKNETTPNYYVGAFKGNQLHLSPVSEIVQMRPQFHHIDATSEMERLAKPRAEGAPRAATGVHMTVKALGEGVEVETMAERIRNTQEEKWRKMKFVDDESASAWETYNELFVENPEAVPRLKTGISEADYLDRISAPRDAARLSRTKHAVAEGEP